VAVKRGRERIAMLELLLMMALSLSDASAAPERRGTAAEMLRAALTETSAARDDASEALARLVRAGREAARTVDGSRAAERIDERIEEARWRELTAPEDAVRSLERALARVAEDLAFVPLIVADLPRGFPAPTPAGELELVRLPAYRLARTDFGRFGSQGAFFTLFRHIQSNGIPMTAPVEMTYAEAGDRVRESAMAFLYAAPDVVPERAGDSVEVVDVEPLQVASLGCRGDVTDRRVEEARDALLAWIDARPELVVAGELRVMGYNSPMVPRERRTYEVQIPVRNRETVIVDFSRPDEARRWQAVDDVVMGGRSASDLEPGPEGTAVFRGDVSLENNGGFASVRRDGLSGAFSGARSIVVACRGDGNTYKLRLRTSTLGDDAAWQASFATVAGEWTEHAFAPGDFDASRRGRAVPGAPPLAFADVTGVGLLIADGQTGSFRLELRSIAAR
jgi:monofunctional biosynthetic peptidoglycan transglycosylase